MTDPLSALAMGFLSKMSDGIWRNVKICTVMKLDLRTDRGLSVVSQKNSVFKAHAPVRVVYPDKFLVAVVWLTSIYRS